LQEKAHEYQLKYDIKTNKEQEYKKFNKKLYTLSELEEADGSKSPILLEYSTELALQAISEPEFDMQKQQRRKEILEKEFDKISAQIQAELRRKKKRNFSHYEKKNEVPEVSQPNEESKEKIVEEQIKLFEKSRPLKPNEEKFSDQIEIKKVIYFTIAFLRKLAL